jgi:hypothetical protein
MDSDGFLGDFDSLGIHDDIAHIAQGSWRKSLEFSVDEVMKFNIMKGELLGE